TARALSPRGLRSLHEDLADVASRPDRCRCGGCPTARGARRSDNAHAATLHGPGRPASGRCLRRRRPAGVPRVGRTMVAVDAVGLRGWKVMGEARAGDAPHAAVARRDPPERMATVRSPDPPIRPRPAAGVRLAPTGGSPPP